MVDGSTPDWLPPLLLLEAFGGDWQKYLEAMYNYFSEDFKKNKPIFNGKQLQHKRYPLYDGKEATFWHIISFGKNEAERTPDFRKCERIRWPKPVIDHSSDSRIKIWKNARRKDEERILIWFEEIEYLVVLADRKSYILFWTAYPVEREHNKAKLKKEYEEYRRKS